MIEQIVRDYCDRIGGTVDTYHLYPGDTSDLLTLIVRFDDGTRHVIKFGRNEQYNGMVEELEETLLKIRTALEGTTLQETIPKPLASGEVREIAYLGQTALPGQPGNVRTDNTHVKKCIRSARDWLCSIHPHTSDTALGTNWKPYVQAHDELTVDDSLPVGLTHGDFGLSNILRTGTGRVNVIDWGTADHQGLPIIDFLTIMLDAAIQNPRVDLKDLFEFVFYTENWYSTFLIGEIDRYAAALGVDRTLIRQHIPLWLNYSQDVCQNQYLLSWGETLTALEQEYDPSNVIW